MIWKDLCRRKVLEIRWINQRTYETWYLQRLFINYYCLLIFINHNMVKRNILAPRNDAVEDVIKERLARISRSCKITQNGTGVCD
jgi:hypothetical protein